MSQNNSHPDDDATLVYRTGDIIFEVGDIGTESYQIVQGEVRVVIGFGPMPFRKQACVLFSGSFFGSMALSSESRARTATCIAAGQGPTVLQIVARVPIKIAVPSLASLLVAKEQRPPKKSENKKYKHGDFVLEQGDSADNTYYVLVTGCLNVIVDSKIVGTIMQTGEVFGESCCCALAEDKVRTASVKVKSLSGAIVSVWQYDAASNSVSSMLHRRRKEILNKNHLREFNCQTERSKSSSSMLLNLRSSIATARPSTLKSNKTNDASPSPTKWNFLRNKFSKSGKQGAKKDSLRHVEQKSSSKWNVLRRMVVQSGTSSRLMHSCTSLNDLTDSAKTNLLDQQAAETGKAVLAVRERKKQDLQLEHKKERQRKERDDKKMEKEQEQKRKEKEKKTIDHQGSENQMNIVRLDLPAVVEPRRDAVHEQVKTDEGRFIVDAKEQERMWEEIIQRKAMGEKNVVAKPPTKIKPQKKQKKHPQKAFVPVVPKKQPKSIVVTKRKKKKKIPDQVKVEAEAVKRTKKKHLPVIREEIVEKIVVEKIEAMPMVTAMVHEVKEVEEPRTLRLSVTAADVKRSIEAYRKAIHQRSENILNMQYTKRQGGAISPKIGMLEIHDM